MNIRDRTMKTASAAWNGMLPLNFRMIHAVFLLVSAASITLSTRITGPAATVLVPWVMPVLIMAAAFICGSAAASALAVVVSGAALLSGQSWMEVAATAVASLICAEILRSAGRPLVAVALLWLVLFAGASGSGHGIHAIVQLAGSAAVTAAVSISLAVALLLARPRKSREMPPRGRIRLDQMLFLLIFGAFSATALAMRGWSASTGTAAPDLELWLGALVVATGVIHGIIAARARAAMDVASGRGRFSDAARFELPAEVAGVAMDATRLRLRQARHGGEIQAAGRTIAHLTRELEETRRVLGRRDAERSRLFRACSHARARYDALMSQSPDATLFVDARGIIQSASRSVLRVLGYQPPALQGRPLQMLIPPHSMDHPLHVAGKLEGDGAETGRDCLIRTAAGKDELLVAHVHPYAVDGANCYAVRLHDAHRMRKALHTLKQAREVVATANRSRDFFIATMSHELRTPLHGLIATLDMMRVEEYRLPEFQQRLSIARISARALLKIANDILDLTRINSGAFQLESRPFDLAVVLEEVLDESRARAESLGLRLETRRPDVLPPSFLGDPARLKQILGNLVSNALKFTSTGGITLLVKFDGKRVQIDVIDTGEGIPEDKWDSIFDPFVQVESSSVRKAGGTGLGLPISRRLAQAMEGSLTLVRSGPDGSTFRLDVPLQALDEAPPEEQSQRIFNNPRGRILVVEDNPANRYVAEALLANLECPTAIVESGLEALRLLERQGFDLILMDCQMPGMDGYETARQVRKLLKQHIPIIAMTANAMAEDKQRCLEAGMDDFLPKPFGRPALHEILCKWLRPDPAARKAELRASKVEELPDLDSRVFQELRESLEWRPEPMRRICETFTTSARCIFPLMDGSIGLDRRALLRQLHALLGSAGMVGARRIEFLARELQETVRKNRADDVPAMIEPLQQAVRRFEAEFTSQLQEPAHPRRSAGRA